MIVADSSYVMEGLLSDKELLSKDQIIVPELIVYEVTNALWKHEHLLKRIQNGKSYLSALYDLIDSGKIAVIFPNESLMQDAYLVAKRNGVTIYDAIFVCLAVKLGLILKTLDKNQSQVFEAERKKEE